MPDVPTNDTELIPWFAGLLLAAVCFMFKLLWAKTAKAEERLEKKLDQCEEKHATANETVVQLTSQVSKLDGRFEQLSVDRKEMMDLHLEVLQEVRKSHNDQPDSG